MIGAHSQTYSNQSLVLRVGRYWSKSPRRGESPDSLKFSSIYSSLTRPWTAVRVCVSGISKPQIPGPFQLSCPFNATQPGPHSLHSVVAENDFIRRMPLSGIPAFGRENRKPRVFFDAWYGVNPEHEDSKKTNIHQNSFNKRSPKGGRQVYKSNPNQDLTTLFQEISHEAFYTVRD